MEKIKAIVFFFVAIFYKKCLWLSKLIYWGIYFVVTILVLDGTNVITFSKRVHMIMMQCTTLTQIIGVLIIFVYTLLAIYIDKNASISVEFLTTFEKRDNISNWEFWKTIFDLKK